jgi:hypothetical protein
MTGVGGDICHLCLKKSELRNSHILPEFFYLGIYDDSHRTLEISHDSERVIQKGLREHLLCQECETKLSRYEGYAVKLIRDIPNFSRSPDGRFLFSENVNYFHFKLFQLSILWRASIAKNIAFAKVDLGPHEEIVRNMLVGGNPGNSSDYGCVMMTMLNTEVLDKVLVPPTPVKPKPFGHTVYKLSTGNITWLFFVTSHHVNNKVQELFLQETGILRVWLASDEKSSVINLGKIMK